MVSNTVCQHHAMIGLSHAETVRCHAAASRVSLLNYAIVFIGVLLTYSEDY